MGKHGTGRECPGTLHPQALGRGFTQDAIHGLEQEGGAELTPALALGPK